MFCTQCGKAITDQNSFCTNCGVRIQATADGQYQQTAQRSAIQRQPTTKKGWIRIVVLAVVGFALYVLGSVAWQVLQFGRQYGQTRMSEQASAPGTCLMELNGYYHCAQDRITPSGANITLRECARSEITTPFPVCWSDQPVPAPPPEDPKTASLPAASWVEVRAKLMNRVQSEKHGHAFWTNRETDVALDYCPGGYKCSVGSLQNLDVPGPAYGVNGRTVETVQLAQFAGKQVILVGNFHGEFDQYNGADRYTPEQRAAIQAFCQQGLALFKSVNFSNGDNRLFSACDQSLSEKSAVESGVSDAVSAPGQSAPVNATSSVPAFVQSVPPAPVQASPPVDSPTDSVPASTPIPERQTQFAFHVSPTESLILPSQSEIINAPRLILRCLNVGQWRSVGLFRLGNEFWLHDSAMGSGTDFYTYAAFRQQGLGKLFLQPATFRVGSYHNVEPFNPMIAQACQSGMDIFADTGNGIVDACKTQ